MDVTTDFSQMNSTSATTELEDPLSVHGGFIALAAGLSVVVPLICVLIVQLRRAKREELNRAAQAAECGEGNESCSEGVAQLPPTYEELFGPGYEPPRVSVMHSRFRSTDVLIHESENVAVEGGGVINPNMDELGEVSNSGSSGGGESEGENRISEGPASIATISGNDVTDVSVSGQSSTSGGGSGSNNSGTSSSNSRVVPLAVNNLAERSNSTSHSNNRSNVTITTTIASHPPPVYSTSNSSVNRPLTAISTPSTQTVLQQPPPPTTTTTTASTTSSSSPPPHPPPLQSSTTSPSSQTTRTNQTAPNTHSPTTSSNSGLRFPGMHISIQEILSVLWEQSDREMPPPSYQEALKILEKAEKEKQAKTKSK